MRPQSTDRRTLAVVYTPIARLKPDPRNPRIRGDRQIQQIAKSIEAFGFNVPVLVDRNLKIIAGHGRVEAARLLGVSEVPTISLEYLTESQAKAFALADNRLSEISTWDKQLLSEQLKSLSEVDLDFSLEATGFEIGEIDVLIEGMAPAVPGNFDPADEQPGNESDTRVTGDQDLWLLGSHRLLAAESARPRSNPDRGSDGRTVCHRRRSSSPRTECCGASYPASGKSGTSSR